MKRTTPILIACLVSHLATAAPITSHYPADIAAALNTVGGLPDGVVTSNQIATGTITGANIAADTITDANIATGTITDASIATGTITDASIATATVTQAKLDFSGLWEDLRFPVNSFNPPGAVSDPDWVNVWGGLYLLGFDANSDESVFIVAQMPHTWDTTTSIGMHVHTTQGAGTSTSQVVWAVEYSWAGIGATYDTSTTTVLTTNTLDGVAYKHEMPMFAAIPAPSATEDESSCIIMRVYRDANHPADTYSADAYMIEFDIHYRVGALGEKF